MRRIFYWMLMRFFCHRFCMLLVAAGYSMCGATVAVVTAVHYYYQYYVTVTNRRHPL